MTHHLWLPEEDDIVDRHARALARGRYRYNSPAVAACCRDLQSLHRRGGRGWVRTPGVTHVRLKRRVAALGLPWVTEALTDDEERVVQRYVSGLARGDHVRVPTAARQCRGELAGLAVGRRSWHPRTVRGLCCLLGKQGHFPISSPRPVNGTGQMPATADGRPLADTSQRVAEED